MEPFLYLFKLAILVHVRSLYFYFPFSSVERFNYMCVLKRNIFLFFW